MELEQAIKNRRSIRNFISNKEVDDSIIYKILESARYCQSAKNRQPWMFMIVKAEKKNKIASILLKYTENLRDTQRVNIRKTVESIIDASVLILVFKEPNEAYEISDNLSIGAAIEHMCLMATDLELGSLWIRDITYVDEEICKYVDKQHLKLMSGVLIGYPNKKPNMRPRKPLDKLIIK